MNDFIVLFLEFDVKDMTFNHFSEPAFEEFSHFLSSIGSELTCFFCSINCKLANFFGCLNRKLSNLFSTFFSSHCYISNRIGHDFRRNYLNNWSEIHSIFPHPISCIFRNILLNFKISICC